MQACGGCSLDQVSQLMQVLSNPGTWVVALAAVTTLLTIKPKKKEK